MASGQNNTNARRDRVGRLLADSFLAAAFIFAFFPPIYFLVAIIIKGLSIIF